MNITISSKTTALTFGVLVVCFAAAFYVVAWTEPTQAPPGGNVSAPINVGTDPQAKAGRISATEFYDYNNPSFYLNPSSNSNLSGDLSIGGNISAANWPPVHGLYGTCYESMTSKSCPNGEEVQASTCNNPKSPAYCVSESVACPWGGTYIQYHCVCPTGYTRVATAAVGIGSSFFSCYKD